MHPAGWPHLPPLGTDRRDGLDRVLEMKPLEFFVGLTFSGSSNLALG